MNQLEPTTHKDPGSGKSTDHWRPAGSHKMREEPSKDVTDGLNGTVFLDESDVAAIGAEPGDELKVRAKANDKEVETTRKLHRTGDSLTLPSETRQELQLDADDEVQLEIAPILNERDDIGKAYQETIDKTQTESDNPEVVSSGEQSRRTPSEEKKESHTGLYATLSGSLTYHFLQDEEAETTVCGISLSEREYNKGEEPGDMIEPCLDCKAHSGAPMTNEERVEWLRRTVGFDQSGGPPAYFNTHQLDRFIEYIIEQQERASIQGAK